MNFKKIKAALLGLAVATGIAACSTHPKDSAPSTSGSEETGSVGYELRLGRTTHIRQASYTITCTGGFSGSGTIDVTKMRELFAKASEALSKQGSFLYRPYGIWADMAYSRDKQTTTVLRKIKGIFDPNNVMNPGKLCF